jgi:uncharacterized protein (TIGR00290 family)
MQHKSYFNWSGGKDSALALYKAFQDPAYSINHLLTNINIHRRVSMHGVREELIEQQAKRIGLPLQKISMPGQPSMEEYEARMESAMQELKEENFTHTFYGDIFLEDLKTYREAQSNKAGLRSVFPLWGKNTKELLLEFIDLGFKTVLVCVKSELLPWSFAGRIIDRDFMKDLPHNVDVCGENGEFHTFVYDGPIFSEPIRFKQGEIIFKRYEAPGDNSGRSESQPVGFWFRDLLPV